MKGGTGVSMSGKESGHSDHSGSGTFPWTEYTFGDRGGGMAQLLAGAAAWKGADPFEKGMAERKIHKEVGRTIMKYAFPINAFDFSRHPMLLQRCYVREKDTRHARSSSLSIFPR